MFEIISVDELIKRLRNYDYRELHVHHTWRPNHEIYHEKPDPVYWQEAMKRFHMDTNGWADIAQHVTLLPDGRFVTGRDFSKNPASISGHNTKAFMMEMIGDFDLNRDPFDGPQKDSAVKLAQYFYHKGCYIRFHNENSSKSCPGTGIKKTEFMQAVKGETVERILYPSIVRMGDRGDTVESLQRKLIHLGYKPGIQDGIFGAMTYQAVTEFQYRNKLTPDGIVGPQTWNKLLSVEKPMEIPVTVRLGSRGDAVELLQEELNHQGYDVGKADGMFGARTMNALIKFQRDNRLSIDGIAGKNTWTKLLGV